MAFMRGLCLDTYVSTLCLRLLVAGSLLVLSHAACISRDSNRRDALAVTSDGQSSTLDNAKSNRLGDRLSAYWG